MYPRFFLKAECKSISTPYGVNKNDSVRYISKILLI